MVRAIDVHVHLNTSEFHELGGDCLQHAIQAFGGASNGAMDRPVPYPLSR